MTTGLLWVAAGGALGASARYLVSGWMQTHSQFPWGSLTINIAGSLCIGLAWGSWSQLAWFHEWGRAFLVVGLLGGFTTFSAFSLETLVLLHTNRFGAALGYVLASVVGCLVAAWFGQRLTSV
ncbi:MAG: fluoride efflux transporter CrcB [Gammaproteobacteria bacterium]|nr:fluoride efflux transporter CrcB [Gammaproteobacteria bacterium]